MKSSFKGPPSTRNSNLILNLTKTLQAKHDATLEGPRGLQNQVFDAFLPKNHKHDPTAVLSKTFKAMDLNAAMDQVLEGTHLLGSKGRAMTPIAWAFGPLMGS